MALIETLLEELPVRAKLGQSCLATKIMHPGPVFWVVPPHGPTGPTNRPRTLPNLAANNLEPGGLRGSDNLVEIDEFLAVGLLEDHHIRGRQLGGPSLLSLISAGRVAGSRLVSRTW